MNGLGHHADRLTDVPGTPMDWFTHQAVHAGEREALNDLGIRQDAFDRGFGNVVNSDNLPTRRPYGFDQF